MTFAQSLFSGSNVIHNKTSIQAIQPHASMSLSMSVQISCWNSWYLGVTSPNISCVVEEFVEQYIIVHNIKHALQRFHYERDGVSNHRRLDCLLSGLFRPDHRTFHRFTGGFPSQRASHTEKVSIWWRRHGVSEVNVSTQIWQAQTPSNACQLLHYLSAMI